MILSYSQIKNILPDLIEGVVLDELSRMPVQQANIGILNNEKNVTTDNEGRFAIPFQNKFPVTLFIRHKQFESVFIKINEITGRRLLFLKRKK